MQTPSWCLCSLCSSLPASTVQPVRSDGVKRWRDADCVTVDSEASVARSVAVRDSLIFPCLQYRTAVTKYYITLILVTCAVLRSAPEAVRAAGLYHAYDTVYLYV